ncbi:C-type lectin domain family 9 member A-like [Hemitrygon akajei]|uniref:C-type lectin domain family 9 member A-like n=1 Tax=Hemitrygon akajei TaxID=2704970 RepID=UPI003BF98CEC
MHSDLRHQFTEMETKYRSVNQAKVQICELLTSRREQTCSKDWIRNEDLCYLISSFKSSYEWAKQLCSIADSKLLEINSDEEENFFNNRVRGQAGSYWIGTCKAGEAASNVVYKVNTGKFECGECKSWFRSCNNDEHRFICEKSASLCLDIPVKIRDLCQQPVELT